MYERALDQCLPTPVLPTVQIVVEALNKHTWFYLSTNHQALDKLNQVFLSWSTTKSCAVGGTGGPELGNTDLGILINTETNPHLRSVHHTILTCINHVLVSVGDLSQNFTYTFQFQVRIRSKELIGQSQAYCVKSLPVVTYYSHSVAVSVLHNRVGYFPACIYWTGY